MVAAQLLKSCDRKVMRVRSPPSAHCIIIIRALSAVVLTKAGCGLDGRAPRLGRGGPQFESGHPDTYKGRERENLLNCGVHVALDLSLSEYAIVEPHLINFAYKILSPDIVATDNE
jgi:hypothetical protein